MRQQFRVITVGFCGAHSTGKTEAAKMLADSFKQRYFPVELMLSKNSECPYPLNQEQTIDSYKWIRATFHENIRNAKNNIIAATRNGHTKFGFLITDRTFIDHVIYALYSKFLDLSEDMRIYFNMKEREDSEMLRSFYHAVFWCRPDSRPVASMEKRDPSNEYRQAIDQEFARYLTDKNYIPYHSHEQALQTVFNIANVLLNN
jgi:hypothetical protein